MKKIIFMLDGCDINFVAEAPADMTLTQLLDQASRIEPEWCACGVRYCEQSDYDGIEIVFDYGDVKKASDDVPCTIHDDSNWRNEN